MELIPTIEVHKPDNHNDGELSLDSPPPEGDPVINEPLKPQLPGTISSSTEGSIHGEMEGGEGDCEESEVKTNLMDDVLTHLHADAPPGNDDA